MTRHRRAQPPLAWPQVCRVGPSPSGPLFGQGGVIGVDANLKRGVSAEEMACRVGVVTRTFQRRFRQAVGMSPYWWFLERRYEWAR